MACDICGKTGTSLNDLLTQYQTEGIKSICPKCETAVNKKHQKLLDFALQMKGDLFKRFILAKKRAVHGATEGRAQAPRTFFGGFVKGVQNASVAMALAASLIFWLVGLRVAVDLLAGATPVVCQKGARHGTE